MKINLDALIVLDAIDRTGSFAKAAQELFRVPSAVSYTVRKLEDDLGIAVFDRSGTRPRLTEAGQTLLDDGRHLLDAARRLEERARRVATGWEAQLCIAIDQILPMDSVWPFCHDFYAINQGTYLRFISEALGGSWDALYTGRADLVIGAPGDHPAGGSYSTKPLGQVQMLFAVAPNHPLAQAEEPLEAEILITHRVIAVADSSRALKPRTHNIYEGQETLTVPNMRSKLAAQAAGLGIGWLPAYLVKPALERGELVVKEVANALPPIPLYVAWKTGHKGRALNWFMERLSRPGAIPHVIPFREAPNERRQVPEKT